MSEKVSAREDQTNIMVTCGPDVCNTPMGGEMVPVGYNSAAILKPSQRLSTSVFNNKKQDFQLNTRSALVKGHEPGTGRGVMVDGYVTYSHAKTASSSVFSEGWAVVRDKDPAWINHPDIGPVEARRDEKTLCEKQIEEIEKKTDQIADMKDPLARNKAITGAYNDLYAQDPSNKWVGLGAIVSAQSGCAMNQANTFATGNIRDALGDGNQNIFRSIYPLAAYRAKHGYANMKRCYAQTGRPIPKKIDRAFTQMDSGDTRGGANSIADYEQRDVVSQTYAAHPNTFAETNMMNSATGGSLYSLPLSQQCGASNTVPFSGSLADPNDRVNYYNKLMDGFTAPSTPPDNPPVPGYGFTGSDFY